MQDNKISSQLVSRAKELLSSGKVQLVIGWRKGLFDYDVTPSLFTTAEDIENNFVYNEWCGANLSKYLVKETRKIETAKDTVRMNNKMAKMKDPNAAEQPEPQAKILVFLKPCDTYSFTELLKEHRINRDDVYAVGIPCDGMKDPEKKELSERCTVCKSKKHVTYDELIGEDGSVQDSNRFDMVEKIEAMSPDERFAFWQGELSRCIRCNACRNVCPACTCEHCIFDNPDSGAAQKVAADDFEESMFHIIRAWHVAGRCTDCGECSRVCPQNIPLHLLNRKFIKDINELYGPYMAGSDMETKPPMLTWTKDDANPGVVNTRDTAGATQCNCNGGR
ncbi:MAG: 4Fe-4S dicluster domain-containing protein [Treponema sp.]|nr:4Fe-4S dicluster domain-containing protein [Treponema sp.]